MNGQGDFAADRAWFRVVLERPSRSSWWCSRTACGAAATPARLRARLPRAAAPPGRTRRLRSTAAATMMLVAVGGYIFYNTNVLNEYRTQIDDEERAAELREGAARIRDGAAAAHRRRRAGRRASIRVELRVATDGRYTLENRQPAARSPRSTSAGPATPTLQRLDLPGARLRQEFAGFNYRIYTFEPPLRPARAREMRFATVREQRGFRNARNQVDIVDNGTFINNFEIAPFLGMGRDALLQDRAKRRKYGLPPELRPPKLEDDSRTRQPLSPARQRLGRPPTSPSRPTPTSTPIAPGLAGVGDRRGRPPHRALSHRRADPALLLDPVGRATR